MVKTIKIEEVMTQYYKWIEEDESLGKALTCFNESCDILLVKDENKNYSGILSEKMILRSGLDRAKTKVKSLKQYAPKINLSTSIPEATRLMIQNDVLHLPIFNGNQVIGIINDMTLLNLVALKKFGKKNVAEFMTHFVQTVGPKEKISVVLHRFRDDHIGRLPVLNSGKVIGIITLHDVVTKVIQPQERGEYHSLLNERNSLWDLPVEGIMSYPVITSSINSSIRDVIEKMNRYHLSGIPILNNENNLTGIVTKKDILGPISLEQEVISYPVIQFVSKLDQDYPDELMKIVSEYAMQRKERLVHASYFIYLRKHKQKNQRINLYSVRCNLKSDFGRFSAIAEGWGLHNAVKNVLINLDRQIHRKLSETRELERIHKNYFWEYVDIKSLT